MESRPYPNSGPSEPSLLSRGRAVSWTVCLLSFFVLAWRGYSNAHFGFRGDDSQLFLGVRQLFSEGTFYRNLDYAQIAPPGFTVLPEDHAVPNAYPPHTALLYLPFYAAGWPLAHDLWFVFTLVCVAALGILLFRQLGDHLDPAALPLWLTLIFLSFPPYDITFLGQISFPMLVALVLGFRWLHRRERAAPWIAGIFLSVALMKPTFALPFVLYGLVRVPMRRAASLGLAFTLAGCLLVAILSRKPGLMLSEYRTTLHQLTQTGGINDTGFTGVRRASFSTASVAYFDFLGAILHTPPETPPTAEQIKIVALLEGVAGLAGGLFLLRHAHLLNTAELRAFKTESSERKAGLFSLPDRWALGAISLFLLLVLYHSWPDSNILYLPLLLLLNELLPARTRLPNLIAAGGLIFILHVRAFWVHRVLTALSLSAGEGQSVLLHSRIEQALLFALLLFFFSKMERSRIEDTDVQAPAAAL